MQWIVRKVSPRRDLLVFLGWLLLALFVSCDRSKQGPLPVDATWGYCPVCNMKVNSDGPWTAEIIYSDKTKLMFESPGDMLAFYVAPGRYNVALLQKAHADIEKILVRDYNTRATIDAEHAALVYKSRVNGPMGPDVFAFKEQGDAASFAASNGGTVVTLAGVTEEMAGKLRK